jgi:DNA helicase-2/ATP-dependent DNA helicase PcrA
MNARKNDADHPPIEGLEDDAVGCAVVREELRLLAVVKEALESAERSSKEAVNQRMSDDARMLELRENVASARPEDLPALFDQMHQIGALRAQRGRGSVGSIDGACPYFGHLRLVEDGKRRDVLVGARSYIDPRSAVKIVDWRNAPVSKIFYRYQEGDDYEEEIGDRVVEGQVLLRRSVAIIAGELIRVSCTEGTYVRARQSNTWSRIDTKRARLATEKRWKGDATKDQGQGAKLGIGADGEMRTDKHLPAIAALLDPEQFKLIARPGSGVVAIQGSAGSGKTTVGLHRMAYLAFTDPQRFRPEKMMAIVPNDALVHYVARVLPSLEVSGVPVMTFTRWSSRVLAYLLTKVPLRINENTPPVVSRAKMHPAMLKLLDALHARVVADATKRLDEVCGRSAHGSALKAAWSATNKGSGERPVEARLAAFSGWLAGKREITGAHPAPDLGTVERMALERVVHELRQHARNVAFHWDEATTSRALLQATFKGIPGFSTQQIDQVADWCTKQARIRSEGERDGDEPTIDAEDPALILRTWQVFRGPITDIEGSAIRLAHLFVDEIQDANPIALRVLLELTGSDRSITLAGDVAQRTLEEDDDAERFDWVTLLEGLGIEAAALSPLKVSYRSTAEITDFARSVLGPLAHDEMPETTRNGPPVELYRFSSQGEAVAFLADALKQLHSDEPTSNIALLARHGAQAEVYFAGLERAEVPNVRIVTEQDFTWNAGVDVTDVRQTKGLEFDEVILLDTNASSYPVNALARRMLYVGATRAAHQLWCIASSEPSQLVLDALGSDA